MVYTIHMYGIYNTFILYKCINVVFFSPFEELRLRTAGIMESKGIHRVYEPSPVPTLYVGRVEDLGPPRPSPSHSMLSGRKCNLNYST
jgi:hypothetical protein